MNPRMSDDTLNALTHELADVIDYYVRSRPQGCDRSNVNDSLTALLRDFGVEFEP